MEKLDRDEFLRLFHEEYDKIKDDESLNLELPIMENKAVESIQLNPKRLIQTNLNYGKSVMLLIKFKLDYVL